MTQPTDNQPRPVDRWTRRLPEIPEKYWWRASVHSKAFLADVICNVFGIVVHFEGGEPGYRPVTYWMGEWAGPLQPPTGEAEGDE